MRREGHRHLLLGEADRVGRRRPCRHLPRRERLERVRRQAPQPRRLLERRCGGAAGAAAKPALLSVHAFDLIRELLVTDVRARLGSRLTHAPEEEITRHAFFAGLDWAGLDAKQCAPPFPISAGYGIAVAADETFDYFESGA